MTLILNVIFLGALIILCWKSPHPWPIFASGFQWMSVMFPIIALTDTRITRTTVMTAVILSTAAMGGTLLWGIWATLKRNRIKFTK